MRDRRSFRTRLTFRWWLAPALLGWMVAASTVILVVPSLTGSVSEAQARKKKKKRPTKGGGRGDGAPKKQIRTEGSLTPKRDVQLDDDITKTKSLKPAAEDDGPRIDLPTDSTNKVENLLDSKLNEEIDLAKELVKFETKCDDVSPVRYRLAELNWEKSKRAFFKANDFNTPEDTRKKYVSAMKQLQQRTIANYKTIVDECEGWDQYPKALYNLGKTLVETDNGKDGAQYFKRIIKEYPDNAEWVSQAWFMIGEYYFNEEQDARQAFRAYERAAAYTDSAIYGFAVYKQGWCHINTGDWDLALKAFHTVVGISDDPSQQLDSKGRISLRKEALKDYVRAYSNVGESKDAFRIFTKLGGKDDAPDMMEKLGAWYINRDAHNDVMTVFGDLIKVNKRSTRRPIFQGRIVNAADKLGDDADTIKQVKLLTEYFKDVRELLGAKNLKEEQRKVIEKDLAEAEDIAENTLRRLASERHQTARKLPEGRAQARAYQSAYELYKHYLEVFPEPDPKATVNYVFFMRYYFAEVLFYMEKFLEAARNYDIVVNMNPNPTEEREKKIVLQAAEDAVRAYDELVSDIERKEGKPEVTGTEPQPIPEVKQDLITACQRYIKYVGTQGEKIVEIRYKMARIYYMYNHFDKAAPAFNDIVENHPDHEVACYAANLALDIHNLAKNYEALLTFTRSYLANNKLKVSCEKNSSGDDFEKFAKIESDAAFLLIGEAEKAKRYVAAANAYMEYFGKYGKNGSGPHAIDAVYNAAVNYDLGQRLDKANEVREFLVKTFAKPDVKDENPLVLETMYNIAQSFERVVDFKKAADYLEKFAEKYPRDKRTKDAIYNAGLYRSTLRDFDGGRAARQKYLTLYGSEKDAHEVKFAICESLELEAELLDKQKEGAGVKKWTDAHDCYFDWTKNREYTDRSTDMLCHAQFRRGEIMRTATKYAKGYQEQRKYLLKSWPGWESKEGKENLPRCATAVSELMFRDLQDEFKTYAELRINPLDPSKQEQFDKSIAAKVKTRDKLIEDYKKIASIGVPEWALGSLFMIGEAYRNSTTRVLQAPIPNKIPGYTLTEEDKEQLRNKLKEMVAPIDNLAMDAYSVCVDTAHRLGVYNKWSVKALGRLQEIRPEQYPPVVERLVEVSFSDPLEVANNGVVIRDGTGFKALAQPLGAAAPAPAAADAPEPKAPKGGGKKPAKGKPAKGAEPAPVTRANDSRGGANG